MKLRNKKSGQIGDFMGTYNAVPFFGIGIDYHDGNPVKYEYNTLTELNEEWEDVEDVGSIELIKEEIGIADNRTITAKVIYEEEAE